MNGGEIMSKYESSEEKVKLFFKKPDPQEYNLASLPKPIQEASIELDNLLKLFKSYKVESIELSIEGSFKTGGVTSLIVSAEGKGGMKVILKPKEK